jgi:hypothetical protein
MPAIELIPAADRLIDSLRDMGYDFTQAVADIVDNSVAANATQVHIDVEFEGENSWVRITDNGTGMKPDTLREAMRYGADRNYDPDEDLGKFGLGLKTASMSQCRRLTVASRSNRDRADVNAYAWDLDHIRKTKRWLILPVSRSDGQPLLHEKLRSGPGTVVLWERLDRVLGFKYPDGEAARTRLNAMTRDLELHLSMVFHRFLSRRAGNRLRIWINENEIQPWDPFCESEPRSKKWISERLSVDEEEASGEIKIEAYILPHQTDFSSPAAHKKAAGPNGWNQQQGFYFYRAGRMIQSGGWSRLRAPDEHTKLARVAISFTPRLDAAFKVNVAKMRVQIPGSVRDELDRLVKKLTRDARKVYDRREGRNSGNGADSGNAQGASGAGGSGRAAGAGASTGNARPHGANQGVGNAGERRLTLSEWGGLALKVASARERPFVETVLQKVLRKHGS